MKTTSITSRKTAMQRLARTLGLKASSPVRPGNPTTLAQAVDEGFERLGDWNEVVQAIEALAKIEEPPVTIEEPKAPAKAEPKKEAAAAGSTPAPEALTISAHHEKATDTWYAIVSEGREELHETKPAAKEATALRYGQDFITRYSAADEAGRRKLLGWKPLPTAKAEPEKKAEAGETAPLADDDRRKLSHAARPKILGVCLAHFFRRLGKLGATASEARAVVEDKRIVKRIENIPAHDGPFTADLIIKPTSLRSEVERSKAGAPTYQAVGEMSGEDYNLLRSVLADHRKA